MAVAQVAAPLDSPPLYDGVIVQEPYRYLMPGPNQPGSPGSYHSTAAVQGTTSQRFAAATTESPPQAQLIVAPGAFVVPTGVTSMAISIEPVQAPQAAADGAIVGNVYRFAVVDQAGNTLAIDPKAMPTVILRASDGTETASLAQYSGGTWQELPTEATGPPGVLFFANVRALGDFAVLVPSTHGPFTVDLGGVVAVVAASLIVVALGFLILRRRNPPTAARMPSPDRRPRPTKRQRKARRRGGSR
jgi:hypothetical protein